MKNIIDNPQAVRNYSYQILYHAGFKNTKAKLLFKKIHSNPKVMIYKSMKTGLQAKMIKSVSDFTGLEKGLLLK
jgi:hypothetical protein